MNQQTIHAVGIDLPGDDFDYIPVSSRESRLDAEIIIYAPGFDLTALPGGRPVADSKVTVAAAIVEENRTCLAHWRQELLAALAQGKTVIVFLPARSELVASDGSGGVDNYAGVPVSFRTLRNTGGKKMKPAAGSDFLADYWREFASLSKYEVGFELEGAAPVLTPASPGLWVGAVQSFGQGTLLLLPPLEFDGDDYTYYDNTQREFFWTDVALAHGSKLRRLLVEIDQALRQRGGGASGVRPASTRSAQGAELPAWVAAPAYQLRAEQAALADIAESQQEIVELQTRIAALQQVIAAAEVRLPEMQRYKGLLFQEGELLRQTVADALELIGCQVAEGSSVQIDGERAICSVTATATAAIDIEQILQLEEKIQADFSADGVTDYARGFLFANPFRTTPPAERREIFTSKALAAAARFGFVLVHTAALFRVVQYLEGTEDQAYAAQIRQTLLAAAGTVVEFPSPPA